MASDSIPELVDIDPSTLHPLSPEVISKQATINLGEIFFSSDVDSRLLGGRGLMQSHPRV